MRRLFARWSPDNPEGPFATTAKLFEPFALATLKAVNGARPPRSYRVLDGYSALSPIRPPHPEAETACFQAFDRELDYLYWTLQRLGARPADTEDLLQDIFAVLHKNWPTLDTTRPLRPWLFGVAFRVVKTHRRRQARETPRDGLDPTGRRARPRGRTPRAAVSGLALGRSRARPRSASFGSGASRSRRRGGQWRSLGGFRSRGSACTPGSAKDGRSSLRRFAGCKGTGCGHEARERRSSIPNWRPCSSFRRSAASSPTRRPRAGARPQPRHRPRGRGVRSPGAPARRAPISAPMPVQRGRSQEAVSVGWPSLRRSPSSPARPGALAALRSRAARTPPAAFPESSARSPAHVRDDHPRPRASDGGSPDDSPFVTPRPPGSPDAPPRRRPVRRGRAASARAPCLCAPRLSESRLALVEEHSAPLPRRVPSQKSARRCGSSRCWPPGWRSKPDVAAPLSPRGFRGASSCPASTRRPEISNETSDDRARDLT